MRLSFAQDGDRGLGELSAAIHAPMDTEQEIPRIRFMEVRRTLEVRLTWNVHYSRSQR
jgi:hypothetical protein